MGFLQNPIQTNGNFLITPEGGYAIKLKNKSGSPSVKGAIVMASGTHDNAFEVVPTTNPHVYMPIGVVYNSGVVDGDFAWVVVSGIAEVLAMDNHEITLGSGIRTVSTVGQDGRAGKFTPDPADAEHFREIGHTLEYKSAVDANRLFKAVLHFN
jgi:hypothetical protein